MLSIMINMIMSNYIAHIVDSMLVTPCADNSNLMMHSTIYFFFFFFFQCIFTYVEQLISFDRLYSMWLSFEIVHESSDNVNSRLCTCAHWRQHSMLYFKMFIRKRNQARLNLVQWISYWKKHSNRSRSTLKFNVVNLVSKADVIYLCWTIWIGHWLRSIKALHSWHRHVLSHVYSVVLNRSSDINEIEIYEQCSSFE
jgi:hypothetical protein